MTGVLPALFRTASTPPATGVAVGLSLGLVLDAAIGDPRRGHPVAAFGTAASRLERLTWRDSRVAGVAYTGVCVGLPLLAGLWLTRVAASRPVLCTGLAAAGTWAVVGGTSLGREATAIAEALREEDLELARRRLPALVGRDPRGLSEPEIARAVVESVAENTSDAAVAPLVWACIAGVPGLLGYRAVNTLDAMVGYRSPRYAHFGWASARLDDVANWLPARLTGWLAVVLAPTVGGSRTAARSALLRDGGRHPSPNAGRCEAAFAGALGVRLGGANDYAGRVEHRPVLGSGRPVTCADIDRAVRLSSSVSRTAAVLCVAILLLRGARTRPGPGR